MSRRILEPVEILAHCVDGKLPQLRLRGREVVGVRRVRDQFSEPQLPHPLAERSGVCLVERFDAPAARVAREERERVRAEFFRLPRHRAVSSGG